MKFKVNYSGFYYIEAENEDEAIETSRDDTDVVYEEYENESVETVEEFEVEF